MTFRITRLDAVTGKKLICGTALTYQRAVDAADGVGRNYRDKPITIYHSDDMDEPIGVVIVPRDAT